MGKGEIAHYQQFLLFLQCFQKACFPGASKVAIVWEWINYWYGFVNCFDIDIERKNNLPELALNSVPCAE